MSLEISQDSIWDDGNLIRPYSAIKLNSNINYNDLRTVVGMKSDQEAYSEVIPSPERILQGKEPDQSEYHDYASREQAREKAYGGKPSHGFSSWEDYWKSY